MRHRFSLRRIQGWRIWQASRTRWERSPLVQRYWTRLGRARVFVALALFAVLFSGVFASGAFLVSAFQSAAPHAAHPHAPARDLRAESKWFQLKHFGNQLPAPDARGNALRQAARLPVSRLGTPRQVSGAVAPNLTTTPGAWTSLGPQPLNTAQCVANANGCLAYGNVSGRITALAVNPLNGADVWAGAAGGGVWHSADGGATWAPMTDTQANLSIGSIAIDPANANTIYVGTGEANFNGDSFPGIGILKTTDGGVTWTQLGFAQFGGLGIGRIAVDPTNSSTLLAAASTVTLSTPPGGGNASNSPGIWRSTDGGATWTHVNSAGVSTLAEGTDVLFDPAHAGVAYAGVSDTGAGIGTGGGVKKSTDHGATWAPATPNLGAFVDGFFRVSLGISADGQHVYAAAADAGAHGALANFGKLLGNGILVSADGGVTWALKSVPLDMANDQGPAGTPPGQQWWYELALNVDRSDATGNTAYVGGINLWKTTDGGTTWTDITNAYNNPADGAFAGVHPDQHALAFVAGSSSFYLGGDGGIWSNAAGVFANKNASLNITQFYTGSVGNAGAHAQLYGGAQDNGTDQLPGAIPGGPAQWNIAVGGDGGDTVVDFTNNAIAYGEFPGGALYRTTDGGTTFFCADLLHNCTGFPGSVNFVMPVAMAPADPNTLVVGTDSVFRTTNASTVDTWGQISQVFTTACIGGFCADPIASLAVAAGASSSDFIYAGTDAGQIFVTTTGGANPTWPGGPIPGSTQGMVTGIAVAPDNPVVAYASFANFATGAGHHLFKTTNAGATWTDISASLPNIPFESVAVDPANPNLVVAGTDAGVFVSQDAGATWAVLATGLPNAPVNQVFFNHTGTELYVATHGRGMWVVTFPHIQPSTPAIALTGVPGASPAPQTLTLTNTGVGPLNWSQTTTLPAWLSLDASSGSIAAGANQTLHLTFTIPPADPAQTYTTTLVFTDPHADNAPLSVPVTLVTANVSTTWYFAEGTTNSGFNEFLTLANPGANLATVQVKYLLGVGAPVIKSYPVAAHSRATVNVNTELGPGQNVAMVVTSDQPIIAERPMFFTFRGTIPSGTDVLGATSLAASFDFGYLDTTVGPAPASHSTWLVLLNQNAFAVDEHIAYFPSGGGAATVVTHTIPANSRGTIEVARDVPAGRYSALVTLTQSGTTTAADGLVERVLYQVDSVTGFTGAAAIVGVPAPRSSFFFAEGFTTPGPNPRFSERYILSNPCPTSDCVGAATAHATLTFQRTDGSTLSTPVTLTPGQQQIVDAASVLGAGTVSNSASVTSDQPILAERFMSFHFAPAALGGNAAVGATEAIGAAAPHNLFYFAEGTTLAGFAEFLTIQNPDPTQTATVTVTLLPTTGAPVVKVLTVGPHSRFTLDVNSVLVGQSLSLVVESNVAIVAERPLYFDFRGTLPGGTDVVGYQP